MDIPRGVPRSGCSTLAQSKGAGALVKMYLGIEIPISFSPLSMGAGVGPKELTNIGLLAANPLMNFIQAFSVGKTCSFNPTNQEMVVAWVVGLAMTIFPRHFGSVRSSYLLGMSADLTSSLL